MSSDKSDVDKKVDKLSRKTNLAIMRKEISFDNQIKQLESKIDEISKNNIKDFDDERSQYYKYMTANLKDSSIDTYRKKLNEI